MPARNKVSDEMSNDCESGAHCATKRSDFLTQTDERKIFPHLVSPLLTFPKLQDLRTCGAQPTQSTHAQSGFGFIGLFVLIQVFFIIGVGAASVMTQLERQKASLKLCRAEVLKIQDTVLERIQQLQSFNTVAQLLRVRKMTTAAALTAAVLSGNIPGAAKLTKELYDIDQQQRGIDALQKGIITALTLYRWSAVQSLSLKIRSQVQQRLKSINSRMSVSQVSVIPSAFRLAIKRDPESQSEFAPSYYFDESRSKEQKIGMRWHYQDREAIADFLRNNTLSEQFCESIPLKENNKWVSVLNPDKFSQKLFYF